MQAALLGVEKHGVMFAQPLDTWSIAHLREILDEREISTTLMLSEFPRIFDGCH
jgi:hypothetical protein